MARFIATSGAAQARDCANLFRFLAFSGLRINEARHVTWADLDFDKGLLQVRVTKNGKPRWVPFNQSLRELLEGFRQDSSDKSVMQVFECHRPRLQAGRSQTNHAP